MTISEVEYRTLPDYLKPMYGFTVDDIFYPFADLPDSTGKQIAEEARQDCIDQLYDSQFLIGYPVKECILVPEAKKFETLQAKMSPEALDASKVKANTYLLEMALDVICVHCGKDIFLETDDLVTCGGAFVVWYSKERNGKLRMTCDGVNPHQPNPKES